MKEVALQLLQDAKDLASSQEPKSGANLVQGRDILSILVRANLVADGPKLSDEEVIDREFLFYLRKKLEPHKFVLEIPTFIVAGHETTSTAVTWTLLALSQAPEAQKKLREEFLSLHTDNPTMDQLNSLPYVENIVREVLRLYPPVPATFRQATEDTVLPVAEPYIDRLGRKRSDIR
jgi:cytochrome P450